MKTVSFGENFTSPIVLCLGFFDCMHLGHVQLLNRAKQMAKNGEKVALFTFCNNHFQTLNKPTKLIYTFAERLSLYQSLGVDVVIGAHFDQSFMSLSGREFLDKLKNYNLQGVVCGEDYTCGRDLTNATQVQAYLQNVCEVQIEQLVNCGGQKVSSTLVRKLLAENNVEQANEFLSQPFFFEGNVVEGRHVGRNIGFPTVNVELSEEKLAPLGVYAGVVQVDEKRYKAVVNVGNTPTFCQTTAKVEAHLLHFCGNLYGKKVKISLVKFLRIIQKFSDGEQLARQLKKDVEVADDQIRT
ncbi:MAG: riboflavin biosynthesis protein RibF [Candidatus Fimimonas sp.]